MIDMSYADVTKRLLLEFAPAHGLKPTSDVIRSCRTDLRGSTNPGSPQSLDSLVRVRFASLSRASRTLRTM
jgi:hypothetical protein